MVGKKLLVRAMAGVALVLASQAQAISFNLIDLGGAAEGTQARQGFDIATAYWSSVLVNSDVTVNLEIGFSQLGPDILGQTSSASSVNFNSQVYTALATHATSSVDASALANLQPLSATADFGTNGLTMVTNDLNAKQNGYVDRRTRIDSDGSVNNVVLSVNTATDKALGITSDANGQAIDYGAVDGSIQFSNQYTFDFNPTDGIAANAIDFIGVATHEIGHALGFVSGVDIYDEFTKPGATNRTRGALENYAVGTPLDLFRYSSAGVIDWSTQNTPYFSVNGGVSQEFGDSLFSTGTFNGDGYQASHWKDNAAGQPQLGIMDPTVAYGQMDDVTGLDIAAFDAIGYQTSFDATTNPTYTFTTADMYRAFAAPVPEVGTWATMIVGLGMAGAILRQRRRFADLA